MHTPSPLFSIIIPTYNCAQYIQQTLRSVYLQTESDYEIIIVNDGSTDNLEDILAQETDPRLRVITQANGGVSRARNRGIAEARGSYLAFLDSDDAWLPFHLARARLFFESFPHYHWYATKLIPIEDINDTDFDIPTPDCTYFATNWFLEMTPAPISQTAVIKREWAQKYLHFPEGIKMFEDNVAWSRFAMHAGAIGTIDKPTCLYRQRKGSASHVYTEKWKENATDLGHDALLLQQKMLNEPNCTIEARLYFRKRALDNWIARLSLINSYSWKNEIGKRRQMTGTGTNLLLYSYIFIVHYFTRLTIKLLFWEFRHIQQKMNKLLLATRKKLD